MTKAIKWAKMSQLKAGDRVLTYGFTCTDDVNSLTVYADISGDLYVCCAYGQHFLDGQALDDGDTLVGVERVATS